MYYGQLKNYNCKDTIAAIATFPAQSAIGIIKISGKRAISIVSGVFLSRKKKDLKKVKTYTLHYGWIVEKLKVKNQKSKKNVMVDEVLVSVMKGPRSYTKEDVVEISCHGGPAVLQKILEIIIQQGARPASPGEFTYRAFVNGRIDLLQAEAIASIVEAKTSHSLEPAMQQLRGEASVRLQEIKETIKELFSHTQALLDFPEDNITLSVSAVTKRLVVVKKKLDAMLQGGTRARILKEGLRCVICGKTNVGKSTLFNRLLNQERVIVSRLPGTTRDVVEETISIRGVPLRIYDTAGILEPKDLVEKKAVEKSSHAFQEADMVLLMLDGSRKLQKADRFLLEKITQAVKADTGKKVIVIINKTDLRQKLVCENLTGACVRLVRVSALRDKGIKSLEKAIVDLVYKEGLKRDDIIFLNQLQRRTLEEANLSIAEALEYLRKSYTIDFVQASLQQAIDAIGRISGAIPNEEILKEIFSRFCIGK
ncbi:MAG: tRNA uridine-5-carboxymethylaminomethyl(34) synthesis GTPase MnmE [Candidatus Omnitrophota bacterium]